MRVIVFGGEEASALVAGLSAEGLDVRHEGPTQGGHPGAGAALVAGLRAGEAALGQPGPGAVLVVGSGDFALGAALTAVKLRVATAWVRVAEDDAAALIGRVAGVTLDATADAGELAAAVRELDAPRIPSS
ncbi:MAG: hypothetical protein ACR2G3_02775 [Solirubrobacterales bacterium]